MHYFVGMEVWQNADGIFLGQGKYVVEIVNRFNMMDYNTTTTLMASNLKLLRDASSKMIDAMMYCQMICSLIYLMNTRPDICFVVNTLRHVHLMVAKHALRYVNGIVDYGLKYESNKKINLEGYVDLDWAVPLIGRELRGAALV